MNLKVCTQKSCNIAPLYFCSKKEEEEAKRKERERREAEEKAQRDQEAQRMAQHQNSMSTPHTEIPSVIPSAPPLIGDYPAPPTSHYEPSVTDDSTVGNNQREHGAPNEGGQTTQSTMPPPPSYSSLYSVPTPR